MSYSVAIDRLHALGLELAPTDGLMGAAKPQRRKFDLVHMRLLAEALGDPQRRFRSVLIAGTNGKGSTAATLASILAAAGLRVGLYTSPHLSRVNERIRVTGSGTGLGDIADDDFARLYFRVDEAAERLVATGDLPHPPSFFEALTALAFLYFAEQGTEIAVLEVGLGGRLDATNIVEPLLSVLTDISLDHQEYLGDTIGEIAREKAGILRRDGILVTLPQHPEANQAIGEIAVALNVRGVSAADFIPNRGTAGTGDGSGTGGAALWGNRYSLMLDGERLEVRSPLGGEHQQRNIALASGAAVELRNVYGYEITQAAIEEGIEATAWPGRLEFLPPNLLLDVAHNPAGAWTLRAAIAALPEERPRSLIFSCLGDKDLTSMSRILFPLFDRGGGRTEDHIVFAPIANPRAVSVDMLLRAAEALDIPARGAGSVDEALELARAVTPDGGLIVVTGSVYLVGEARAAVLRG
jgi:dihydrofolate synthase / folylpolyglutamate synthase